MLTPAPLAPNGIGMKMISDERIGRGRGLAKRVALLVMRKFRRPDLEAMFWWRGRSFDNAGDTVGPFLFRAMTGRWPTRRVPSNRSLRTVVLSAGSILHYAREDTVVWGSGIMARDRPLFRAHSIRAVRGPHSRRRLMDHGIECPEIYGDPALLLPLFLVPRAVRQGGVGFIPHYVDFPRFRASESMPGVRVIDITKSLAEIMAEVVSCDRVVSSSLHGIIFAHAYGVPAVRVNPIGRLSGDGVKFEDYFDSVGLRSEAFPGRDFRDILRASEFTCLPEQGVVSSLQRGLMQSCPFRDPREPAFTSRPEGG